MANIFVGQMKDIVRNYYQKMRNIRKKMHDNSERYIFEFAEEENAVLRSDALQARESALSAIERTFTQVRNKIACASFPNVESLTADRLFFQEGSGFTLSPDELKAFCDRYHQNRTMLKLIQNYCERIGYHDIQFVTEEEQVGVYKTFAKSAQELIRKIYHDENTSESVINAFADPQFAPTAELYSKVGDGKDLDNLPRNVPESASHRFDSITLDS